MISIEYLRQFRVGDFALFDFAAAFLGIALLSPVLSWLFRLIRVEIPKKNWLFLAVPIGVLAHFLVGTITPLTKNILDIHSHWLEKIVLIVLFILGMRGVQFRKHK